MQHVTAVVGVILAICLLRLGAQRAGLVDVPGGRRQHDNPVPLVGGLAIAIGLALAFAVRGSVAPAPMALLVSAAVVIAGGVLDDNRELSARVKLLIQLIAATVLAEFGETLLTHLGALFSSDKQGLGVMLAVPFTVLAMVGVMNAMNMVDGADGLAGGITLTALFWFGVAASLAGMASHVWLIGLIASAVCAYLCFNVGGVLAHRYKVFLGDAGSVLLGLLLAWCAIDLAMGPFPALNPITAVWILAVPICDSVSLMLRRTLRRRSPFSPDREHFHHLLQDAGFSTGQAVALMVVISFTFGGIALFAQKVGVPEYVMFYLSMVVFAAYSVLAARFYSRVANPSPPAEPQNLNSRH